MVSDDERKILLNSIDKEIIMHSIACGFATLMSSGYLSPFNRYMDKQEVDSVCKSYLSSEGVFCPIPIVNLVDDAQHLDAGKMMLLRDPNIESNPAIGVQKIEKIEQVDADELRGWAKALFGTDDTKHPGVGRFMSQGNHLISGELFSFNHSYYPNEFAETFRTAEEIRNIIAVKGWKKVVAFQTRNPMHRAHEELCTIALDECKADGLVIHMLLGKLKAGDIPAVVRDNAIRAIVDLYMPKGRVLVAGYGFDMLYAGPREALLHAIMRQNMGASFLIVGRDHAGVGDYYSPFAAQEIFDKCHQNNIANDKTLEIKIFKADHTGWSKKLGKVVMYKDVPDHGPDDFIQLSGTKVRKMLAEGKDLPTEFTRPEVAKILSDYYRKL